MWKLRHRKLLKRRTQHLTQQVRKLQNNQPAYIAETLQSSFAAEFIGGRVATSQLYEYPKREQVIFDACMSATGNGLLISECQDFISSLRRCGYVLRPLKKRRAAKPASNKQSTPCFHPSHHSTQAVISYCPKCGDVIG